METLSPVRPLRMLCIAATLLALGTLTACADDANEPGAGSPSTSAEPSESTGASPCWGEGSDSSLPSTSPDAQLYVGLTGSEARDLAKERDQPLRVGGRDGECYPLTMDYRPNRVNVYIESDLVVAATLG